MMFGTTRPGISSTTLNTRLALSNCRLEIFKIRLMDKFMINYGKNLQERMFIPVLSLKSSRSFLFLVDSFLPRISLYTESSNL